MKTHLWSLLFGKGVGEVYLFILYKHLIFILGSQVIQRNTHWAEHHQSITGHHAHTFIHTLVTGISYCD